MVWIHRTCCCMTILWMAAQVVGTLWRHPPDRCFRPGQHPRRHGLDFILTQVREGFLTVTEFHRVGVDARKFAGVDGESDAGPIQVVGQFIQIVCLRELKAMGEQNGFQTHFDGLLRVKEGEGWTDMLEGGQRQESGEVVTRQAEEAPGFFKRGRHAAPGLPFAPSMAGCRVPGPGAGLLPPNRPARPRPRQSRRWRGASVGIPPPCPVLTG
jgi:hypothetical protein